LQRSRGDRVVAGVCGGIARYFDVDATLVRVAAIVSIAFGGFGFVAYVVAFLLIADEGAEQPIISGGPERRRGLALMAAATLGVIVLFGFAAIGEIGWGIGAGWPIVLLAAGGALLYFLHERDRPDVMPATAPSAPPAAAPSAPSDLAPRSAAAETASARTGVDPSDAPAVADPSVDDATADTRAFAPGAPPAGPPDEPPTATHPLDDPGQEPAPKRERGSWIVTLFATGGVLVGLATAGTLDAAGAIDLGWGAFAAIAVILSGVALVASAFFGGARGLIPVGILLALVLGTTAAAGVSLEGGIGEREHRVVVAADLEDRYELAIGRMGLDLRGLELPPGETRISANVDIGQLAIFAPEAAITGGEVDHRGDGDQESGGLDVNREITVDAGDGTLVIDAHVGAGVILVSERPDGETWSDVTAPPRFTPISSPAAPAAPRCTPVGFGLAPACATGGDDAA
jgi:phage shock protein PspC (stress-responsive transcriptional regulator)